MVNPSSSTARQTHRLRERLKEATREAILEAAEQAFARDGVHAARMETIARAAGVAVGTLYNHFEDRTALLDALMRARRADLLRRLDQALEASPRAPFVEQLETFITAVQGHFTEHGDFLRMLMEAEYVDVGKRVLQPGALMKQIRERLGVLVERGLRTKALRPDDAAYFAWFFLGAMKGLLARRMKGAAPEPFPDQRAALVRFLLGGAGAP